MDNETKARIFSSLARKHIKVKAISQSNDELNLSLVIRRHKLLEAISAVHNDLCEEFDTFICVDEK